MSAARRRNSELPLDQVEPGDHFGDRVLDLQTGVHFNEMKLSTRVDNKLDSAGICVLGGFHQRQCRVSHAFAKPVKARHQNGRRFFDHFLVAPLDAAFTFEQVHGVPWVSAST